MLTKHHRRGFGPVALAGLGLIWALAPASIAAQTTTPAPMPDPARFAAEALPAPRMEPGELPRPCASANALQAETDKVGKAFEQGLHLNTVLYWSVRHFQYADFATAKRCTDWDFTLRKFQAAVGNPVTGVAGAADLAAIRRAINDSRPKAQAAWLQSDAPGAAEARARNAAAAAEAGRQQAAREKAPTIFGVPFGVPLDLPVCGRLRGGERPAQTCQAVGPFATRYLVFSQGDRPGWVESDPEIKMQQGNVAEMVVSVKNREAAIRAFTERFGEPGTRFGLSRLSTPGGAVEDYEWRGGGLVAAHYCKRDALNARVECSTFRVYSQEMRQQQSRQQQEQTDKSLQQGRKL